MKPVKITLLTYVLVLLAGVHSQAQDRWVAFMPDSLDVKGFKDATGKVRIDTTAGLLTPAHFFDHIMAVTETRDGKRHSYYLTKAGRKVGIDSLHYYDNTEDCESEGFIRFRSRATGLVGMFDKNGNVAIPAAYNGLSRVNNGLAWAIKGAHKVYLGEDKEHYSFKGGETILLNTKNEVVLRNFPLDGNLNLFSLKISDSPSKGPNRKSFKGNNGKFYSFIDVEQEFKDWLHTQVLNSLSIDKLLAASFDSITFWKEEEGWVTEAKAPFLKRNEKLLLKCLTVLKGDRVKHSVFTGSLNHFIFQGESFAQYYNNCGEAKEEKYPTMHLVIDNPSRPDVTQNNFEFLRTDKGYRLISVSISNGNLK